MARTTRFDVVALCALVILSSALPTVAGDTGPCQSIAEYVARLEQLHQSESFGSTELARSLHRLRNADAMVELVEALAQDDRPAAILYLAAGSHLAPLALCATLPEDAPCRLILTETDSGVRRQIASTLDELEAARYIRD
jgi:HEAT repeat protein